MAAVIILVLFTIYFMRRHRRSIWPKCRHGWPLDKGTGRGRKIVGAGNNAFIQYCPNCTIESDKFKKHLEEVSAVFQRQRKGR